MFKQVKSEQDIDTIIALAKEIWTEHYTPIIGSEQVTYMLANFHSKEQIQQQIAQQNYHFYLIVEHNCPVGYLGVQLQEHALFLSKLYILNTKRAKGFGKRATDFIINFAKLHHKNKIYLTVNKHNHGAINAYTKIGFNKVKEMCVDIGGGYVMDDYQLELKL